MRNRVWILLLLVPVPALTFAQPELVPEIEFSCGNAEVKIEVIRRDVPQRELRVEPILTLTLNGVGTTLRYWGGIDYIGGICASDARGKPVVVYQAYCGGSGCEDLANWGIVDATNLRVLLAPRDRNAEIAREILGTELPKIRQKISVHRADQRLYPDQQ